MEGSDQPPTPDPGGPGGGVGPTPAPNTIRVEGPGQHPPDLDGPGGVQTRTSPTFAVVSNNTTTPGLEAKKLARSVGCGGRGHPAEGTPELDGGEGGFFYVYSGLEPSPGPPPLIKEGARGTDERCRRRGPRTHQRGGLVGYPSSRQAPPPKKPSRRGHA